MGGATRSFSAKNPPPLYHDLALGLGLVLGVLQLAKVNKSPAGGSRAGTNPTEAFVYAHVFVAGWLMRVTLLCKMAGKIGR